MRQLAEREATKMEIEVVRDYRRTRHEQERLDTQLNQLQQQIAQVGRARDTAAGPVRLPPTAQCLTFNSTKHEEDFLHRAKAAAADLAFCLMCCADRLKGLAEAAH